jgi:hypothetical protein
MQPACTEPSVQTGSLQAGFFIANRQYLIAVISEGFVLKKILPEIQARSSGLYIRLSTAIFFSANSR